MLKSWFNTPKTRVLVLTCHRKVKDDLYKYSFHIHFLDVYAKNIDISKEVFKNRLYDHVDNPIIKCCDILIYSSDRNFRMLGQSKHG